MKKIFLALTGSIACVKSFDLIKSFQERGYDVQIILTKGGEKFSSRLALESMSGFPVLGPEIFSFKKTEEYTNPFQKNTSEIFAHLELSSQSRCLVIAPCSANFLEKMASGKADDFLSTALLAYQNPIIVCPAMNTKMLENSAVQKNIKKLYTHQNISFVSPKTSGVLACRQEGAGKMADKNDIVLQSIREIFSSSGMKNCEISQQYAQKNILISLGGTQEKIDPVRFVGNFSTGKTGKILAEKCFEMGAKTVSVVQGNSRVEISEEIFDVQMVSSAQEMKEALEENFLESDIVIFSAAVSDFIPRYYSSQKIKKNTAIAFSPDEGAIINIPMRENIDIAKYYAQKKLPHQIFIGFALETGDEDFLKNSLQQKSEEKSFDIVIGNSPNNIGTDSGDFLVYFAKKKIFQKFSGKKSEIFEEILMSLLC